MDKLTELEKNILEYKRPKKIKKVMKQVHFDIDLCKFIEFERIIYARGENISDYFRKVINKAIKSS